MSRLERLDAQSLRRAFCFGGTHGRADQLEDRLWITSESLFRWTWM